MRKARRFVFLSLLIAMGMLTCVPSVWAQRGGPSGRGGSVIDLLFRDDIRQEIELVDEQESQLRELGSTMRDSMRSVFGEIRQLPEEERRDAMMAKMQELRETAENDLKEILLDHQFKRLQQLQFQSRLESRGAGNALQSDEMREKLNLTNEQLEQLQEITEKAQEELTAKIREATLEAREKVLSVLTPEQRATFDEIAGDSFSFRNNRGRGFRGGFGNRDRRGERRDDRQQRRGRRPTNDDEGE